MADTKIVGYGLAILGLGVIAVNKIIFNALPFLSKLGNKGLMYVIVAGVALVAVGAVLAGGSSSSHTIKQAGEEVPIYAGVGKNRKIVGYQRASVK